MKNNLFRTRSRLLGSYRQREANEEVGVRRRRGCEPFEVPEGCCFRPLLGGVGSCSVH